MSSSISQNLQQGLTNPEYMRVLNKTYSTKEKTPRVCRLKGYKRVYQESRITFA